MVLFLLVVVGVLMFEMCRLGVGDWLICMGLVLWMLKLLFLMNLKICELEFVLIVM